MTTTSATSSSLAEPRSPAPHISWPFRFMGMVTWLKSGSVGVVGDIRVGLVMLVRGEDEVEKLELLPSVHSSSSLRCVLLLSSKPMPYSPPRPT